MATTTGPTMFGASIIPTTQQHSDYEALQPPQLSESPALTPAVSRDGTDSEKPIPPHSPFYQHPPASFERIPTHQSGKNNFTTLEKDVESGHATPLCPEDDENPFTKTISLDRNNPECKMWPSRQTLMQTKMAEKKKKRARALGAGCVAPAKDFWNRFDKRQQLYLKIAIAFVLVGVAVAIGVGISKAVHGGYYTKDGEKPIGGSGS